jgi:hypothetical protein
MNEEQSPEASKQTYDSLPNNDDLADQELEKPTSFPMAVTESTEHTSSASNGSSGSETKKRTLSDVAMPDQEPETSAFAESAEGAVATN